MLQTFLIVTPETEAPPIWEFFRKGQPAVLQRPGWFY